MDGERQGQAWEDWDTGMDLRVTAEGIHVWTIDFIVYVAYSNKYNNNKLLFKK